MKQAEKENDILMKQFDDLAKEAGMDNYLKNKNNKIKQTNKYVVQNESKKNKSSEKKNKIKTTER
jgi:hypothetical protein